MERNLRKKLKNTKGITLVALVVTIIVLLILAGVSLNAVFNQGGIFNRAEQAVDKHGQAKARETLELALGEAQMQKYEEGLTDEQLTDKINEIGEEIEERENPDISQAIVDGYIFSVDRTVPKILDYLGPADGVIITAIITQNGNWQNPVATLSGTIKTYSGGTITSSTATVLSGNANVTVFPTTGGNYTIGSITKDTSIKIIAIDSTGKTAEKTINVVPKRDTTSPILSNPTAKADNELKIKISINAVDNESGLSQLSYDVTPTTITPSSGSITSGQVLELTATEEKEYIITFTATDNAGNTSTAEAKAITVDGGVIKHIKLSDGTLKEANTKNIYGSDVLGYNCARTGVDWQIFYIDEEDEHRVYLISKEYMAPPTTETELTRSALSSGYPKAYRLDAILNKYEGTIPNTDFTKKFLSEFSGKNAIQETLQATNYMLNQTIWAEYINRTNADYAFGGPTIPLFQASYNDVCKTSAKLERRNEENGYDLKIGNGVWGQNQSGLLISNKQVGLYFNSTGAESMWIASPAGSAGYIWTNHLPNGLGQAGTNHNICGFRPIVSLKTTVQFTDNGDGTYTIVN